MEKKMWYEVIRKALYIHAHKDEYAYLYGCKGDVIRSRAQFNEYVNREKAYFSKYSASQLDSIYAFCFNKICYDCSGFIGAITGCNYYSGAQWDRCDHKSTNLASGVAGSLLYKKGHIALDIGFGFLLHFPVEGKSCEISKISESGIKFEGTGQLSGYIDYTGASNV